MIGHVGTRVGALVDGQLPEAESERLWSHVHGCPACRDLVEREGWVKTRLAGLALRETQPPAPDYLHSVLSEPDQRPGWLAEHRSAHDEARERPRMMAAVLGAGSVGAALCGVLVLTVPAQAPGVDRRGPVTSLTTPTVAPRPVLSQTASQGASESPGPVGPGASRMARVGLSLAE